MAADTERAERIRQIKAERPEWTWGHVATEVGVSERTTLNWAKTGEISYSNAEKLAKLAGVEVEWLWRGPRGETPDLMETINGDGSQLDRIETRLEELDAQLKELSGALAIGVAAQGEQRKLLEQIARQGQKAPRRGRPAA